MQPAPQHSADLADALLRFAPYVIAFAGPVWGLLLYRRREAAQQEVSIADARVKHETAEEIEARRARDDRKAFVDELRGRIDNLRAQLQELKDERETERVRVKMLEQQNEQLNARHTCDQTTIKELRLEIERLSPPHEPNTTPDTA